MSTRTLSGSARRHALCGIIAARYASLIGEGFYTAEDLVNLSAQISAYSREGCKLDLHALAVSSPSTLAGDMSIILGSAEGTPACSAWRNIPARVGA